MRGHCTLRFYDYYEAHFAAHRFREAGHRAEVFDYTLTLAFWPTGGFRVDVFENPAGDDEDEPITEPLAPGRLGLFLDNALRMVARMLVIFLPAACFFLWMKWADTDPPIGAYLEFLFPWLVTLLAVIFSALISIYCYHRYRDGSAVCAFIFGIIGVILSLFRGGPAIMVSLPLAFGKRRREDD